MKDSTLLIITGLSGAGKSSAQAILSDLGFYAIENLPLVFFNQFLSLREKNPKKYRNASLLLDIDSGESLEVMLEILSELKSRSVGYELLFLDAQNSSILKRYSETRRPHPAFDPKRDQSLEDTIQRERSRLEIIKEKASLRVDTTDMSIHDLKRSLKKTYEGYRINSSTGKLRVNFLSFGFKYGAPISCDLLMDVRFLPNPYFVEGLRAKTGKDFEVSEYVYNLPAAQDFYSKYINLLNFLLPQYIFEGKAYLNIGIGCTGGRHRSVASCEYLAKQLKSDKYLVSVEHRDIDR